MKSLPGSQPLLGEISPELVAGILGRSYDATPCVWLPFRSVFSSCPSLHLSLRLVLSFSLFLFLVLLLFCSVAPLISSITLLYFFFYIIALCFISYFAHSLPPLYPAHLCFSPLRSPLSVFFSFVSPCFFFSTVSLPFSSFFLLYPSSGFYSQRMHALWQAHGNGRCALWW